MAEYDLENWVRVVYRYQNLIPLKNKKLNRKFSYYQISNLPDDVLFNYYLIIMQKLLGMSTQEEKSTTNWTPEDQERNQAENRDKADIDGFINDQIYETESRRSYWLGPEGPNPLAQVVEEATESWYRIHKIPPKELSIPSSDTRTVLSSTSKVERDGNDMVYVETPSYSYDEFADEKRSFLGPTGPGEYEEPESEEEHGCSRSLHL